MAKTKSQNNKQVKQVKNNVSAVATGISCAAVFYLLVLAGLTYTFQKRVALMGSLKGIMMEGVICIPFVIVPAIIAVTSSDQADKKQFFKKMLPVFFFVATASLIYQMLRFIAL